MNQRSGWIVAGSLLLLAGCGSGDTRIVENPIDPTQERLMKVGRAYVAYCEANSNAPQSEKQLRPLLEKEGNPDELLRSPRDNEPFVICWNVNLLGNIEWAQSTPVLGYEKSGAGGTRYVLTTLRSVQQMSDDDFYQASFPPGHQPPQ